MMTETRLMLVLLSVIAGISFFLVLRDMSLTYRDIVLGKRAIKAAEEPEAQRPPKFAEYLLYFLPKKQREPLLGDLEQEYRDLYKRHGKKRARFWYYCQVGTSFWPLIMGTLSKALKWGLLGWVGNWIRHLIS